MSEPAPSDDLLGSWLGDYSMYDFQLGPGEDDAVDPRDPEAIAAARAFRDVLGRYASGVTVITAIVGETPVGMTCQSFSSVSLNPPLVTFLPSATSRAWPEIQRAGAFCVNFLAEGQADLSNQMASRTADKFAGVSWTPAPATGSPLVADALGYVDCRIQAVHTAGDHYIVVGRVLELDAGPAEKPLLFFQGRYTSTESSGS